MAVFRSFCRMMKTALFALVVAFVSVNAFGDCTYTLEPGEACVQNTAVECAPGCYCPGGINVSSSQEAAVLQGSCNAATPGSSITGGAVRCPSNLPYSDSGARYVSECYGTYSSYTPQFYIETTTDTTEFDFIIQAKGTFYIDCDVNNIGGLTNKQRKKKYDLHNTNYPALIKCKYNSDGQHYKIGIASENVTEYNYIDDDYYIHYYDGGVIAFVEPYADVSWSSSSYYRYSQNASHVYKISGSLGKIFPTLGTNSENQQPRFAAVFYNATNLTGTLPTNLFTGDCVYNTTTKKCSSGKGIYGRPVDDMFAGAFYNCSNLSGSIPDYFFGYLYGDSLSEYENTEDSYDMFSYTFANCSGLTGNLSDTWFKNLEIHDPNGTFDGTFKNCTGLSGNIPSKFFGDINGELACSTDGADDTFGDTFENTQISGTIPYDLFEGIDGFLNNNDYGTQETTVSGDWCADPVDGYMEYYETFQNTNMATSCADDEYQYVSGLEIMFGNRGIICKKCPAGTYGTGGKHITSCLLDNTPYFTVKTINMDAGTEFKFMISALGSYRVDWGDGTSSVLSTNAEDVEGDDDFYIEHTYTTSGVRTIKIYGNTIAYSNETEQATISFRDGTAYEYIEEIHGSIGSVFPTVTLPSNLSSGDFETHPVFYEMCRDCSNLTTIDSDMFSGVTGAIEGMFEETFYGCYNLQSIPSGLFSGITGNASELFYETFYDCDSIESVPSGLFSGISGAASSMFSETFYSCESLKTIPDNLFSGVSGAASSMFYSTFEECDLRSIPSGLFANVDGANDYMFSYTFAHNDNLTSIPSGLFDTINETAEGLFSHTFYNCDGLTSIPADLFKNISGTPQTKMFYQTFAESPEIRNFTFTNNDTPVSYIPSTFFGALENSDYTTSSNTDYWVAQEMFKNDEYILETCPSGTVEFNSKFKTEYAAKVSCVPIASYNINYVLNGGTIPNSQTNPTSVQINSGTGKIEYPTRSGWNFAGWNISGMDSSTHSYWKNGAWKEFSSQTLTHEQSQWFKNLRSTSGTVTFTAVWQKYCSSGTYYNPTTQTCDDCPIGFYCPGGEGYTDTPEIVGKKQCPNGFTSNAKTQYITQCYKNGTTTCAVANPVAVAENASSVQYATSGNVACKIYPEEDYEDTQKVSSCVPDNPDTCEVIGMNCNTGYTSTQVTSVLSTKNIPYTFDNYDYMEIEPNGTYESGDYGYRNNKTNSEYDVWLKDDSVSYGIVRGRSLCSSTPGTNGQIGDPSTNQGTYCWCKTTLFKENDNDTWSPAISSWVRAKSDSCNGNSYDNYEDCANECSYECSNYVIVDSNYDNESCTVAEQTVRTTLFNDSKTYICEPNIYTITLVHGEDATNVGPNTIYAKYSKGFYPTLQDAQNETNAYTGSETISKPTRTGYTFGGYYRNSDSTRMLNVTGNLSDPAVGADTIPYPYDVVTQDETWTAHWSQIEINLSYIYNDDNATVDTGMCTYNSSLTVPGIDNEEEVKPGYKFMGWIYRKE